MEITKRITKLTKQYNAILFTSPADCLYLTKFNSTNMSVVYIDNKWYAVTDERYLEAATKQIKNMKVLNSQNGSASDELLKIIKAKKIKEIAIDKNKISVGRYDYLQNKFGKDIKLVLADFSDMRQIKTKQEIAIAKKAASITDKIWAKLKLEIKPGKTEMQIKKKLLKLVYETDADGPSFDFIVATGANGSKPHWRSADTKIKVGNFVTVDFGIIYKGICSDMTRTVIVGKSNNECYEKVYNLVLEAQMAAIKAIKPGVICSDIDKIARDIIEKGGYGEYFIHGLGHSYGIEIHESPRFHKTDNTVLEAGMLMTVEPGIYIDGHFGLRIEDDILVTKTGCEVLTKSPKKLEFVK